MPTTRSILILPPTTYHLPPTTYHLTPTTQHLARLSRRAVAEYLRDGARHVLGVPDVQKAAGIPKTGTASLYSFVLNKGIGKGLLGTASFTATYGR